MFNTENGNSRAGYSFASTTEIYCYIGFALFVTAFLLTTVDVVVRWRHVLAMRQRDAFDAPTKPDGSQRLTASMFKKLASGGKALWPAFGPRLRGFASSKRRGQAVAAEAESLMEGCDAGYTEDGKLFYIEQERRPSFWNTSFASLSFWNKSAKAASNVPLPLPAGWEESRTHDNVPYFVNHVTMETTWVDPRTGRAASDVMRKKVVRPVVAPRQDAKGQPSSFHVSTSVANHALLFFGFVWIYTLN
ncbi:hypothetical protein BDK51DRAFT_52657 [Blyttiomyces helicus]|uniref:WW domain-containing protein n=1 Tax=Blyttiomyces helicus TaxID=388810 RepID=A0A4P9WNG3_9FUNG|nr:hypothetical protein BDK51DRAFT_52657 [Blyttiomyces helicus]|eukprot:RKO93815.1 hypothetical protein BDK51DRAFT_52657 [Blyttiomyces helicus]